MVVAAVWAIAGLLLLGAEVVVPSMFFWPVGVAAIATSVAAGVGLDGIEQQLAVFVVTGALLLILTRTAARRYFLTASPQFRSNAAAIPGEIAAALSEIDRIRPGQVKLHGIEWLARSRGRSITAGTTVRVVRVDGITLIV
ncbi:MAG: NfeD family protein, partial [Chloroflexota bacterium]|nr:NfeD family protein [Chloroflexota bacterium]